MLRMGQCYKSCNPKRELDNKNLVRGRLPNGGEIVLCAHTVVSKASNEPEVPGGTSPRCWQQPRMGNKDRLIAGADSYFSAVFLSICGGKFSQPHPWRQ